MIKKGQSMGAGSKIRSLLSLIAGVAASGLLYGVVLFLNKGVPRQSDTIFVILLAAFLVQSLGSLGVVLRFFSAGFLRPGRIINILQWIAGILGVAGIFDSIMRFSRKSEWMMVSPIPLTLDILLIVLFALWMAVSHYIEKDMAENKVCRFC